MTPKRERIFVWMAGVIVALPFALVRLPPMRDLVMHEASVSVLRHWGDASLFPPGLYTLNLGHPNQLFSLLSYALSLVVPTTTACKLVAAASIAAMAPAAAHLAGHLGRPRFLGVVALPAVLGWLFYWGVVQNILGFAVLLATLPLLDRACKSPSPRGAGCIMGILALLYLAHLQMMGIAGLFLAIVAAARPRKATWIVLPVVPITAVVLVAERVQPHTKLQEGVSTFAPVLHKLVIVPGMLFPGQTPLVRFAAWVPVVALFGLLVVARRRAQAPLEATPAPTAAPTPAWAWGDRLASSRFAVLGALLVVAYFAAPLDVHGAHLIYHRFLPPAFVLALILVAPERYEGGLLVRSLAIGIPLVSLATIAPAMQSYDTLVRDYETLVARIEPGSAVMNYDVERTGSDLVRGVDLQALAVALRGGRSAFDFTQSPISPAVLSVGLRWDESKERLLHFDFRPSLDLTYYRYLFVHVKDGSATARTVAALSPDARLLATQGEWMLFESTLPLTPVTSRERAPPSVLPPTFADRFLKVDPRQVVAH